MRSSARWTEVPTVLRRTRSTRSWPRLKASARGRGDSGWPSRYCYPARCWALRATSCRRLASDPQTPIARPRSRRRSPRRQRSSSSAGDTGGPMEPPPPDALPPASATDRRIREPRRCPEHAPQYPRGQADRHRPKVPVGGGASFRIAVSFSVLVVPLGSSALASASSAPVTPVVMSRKGIVL